MRKIKILLEVPENFVDVENPLFGLGSMLGDTFEHRLMDKAVDEAVKQIKIPQIKIKPEEIKNRMLDLLARRALENKDDV